MQCTLPKMERPCSCCKDYGRYHGDKDVDILVNAARKRHHNCVESAVKLGAGVNVISRALIRVVQLGETKCLKTLLMSVHDRTNIDVDSAFSEALLYGKEDIVELLIQEGADVNSTIGFYQTPLIKAVYSRHANIVELLIKSGADVNVPDENGQRPLIKAAWLKDETIVELLIKSGADVNAWDQYGNTALLFSWATVNCIKLLLQAGACVNKVNKTTGMNTLSSHLFNSREINRTVVELLSSAGEDIIADSAGRRPASTPEYLKPTELRLKHFCRETIRKHLLQVNKTNLFVQVPKIGLPPSLAQYLLYDVSLEYSDQQQ